MKILVGLSGGVDSAVSAYLLKQAGHDVSAGFMVNYVSDDEENCTTKKDLEVAKEVAEYLEIPFFTFDYVKEYDEKILNYLYEGYKNGITPNPDVWCNSEVKFKLFLEEGLEAGFDAIATGHYARIVKTSSPTLLLKEKGEVIGVREMYSKTPGYVLELAKNLRKSQTPAEEILWEILRNRNFEGLKFRRQHPFGRYIADFYCSEVGLVIELDGKIHEFQQEYDMIRETIISSYGVKILRIKNDELLQDIESVLQKIIEVIPSPERRGLGGGDEETSSPTFLHNSPINGNDYYHLLKGVDAGKDQSYFLSTLNQFQLSKALFPIGHLQKSEVRDIALKAGLPNAERKDSQGLCFVGKVDFEEFLKKKIPVKVGNIVDTSGKVLGTHDGVYFYTIGQRKGLNIGGLKNPVFVIKKDIIKNELIVGTEEDYALYNQELTTSNIHFIGAKIEFPFHGKAKIRYRQADQDVVVSKKEPFFYPQPHLIPPLKGEETEQGNSLPPLIKGDGGGFIWQFSNPQRAISSGQVVALYDGDELIASAVID